ncbi:acetyl-CoA carboxylase biotin carboxyl carrier protein subunit [Bacteroidetes/Chlorobi group bacterium ChocPot_Mid]|jgi:biotin carboxyl carrier protein|nr:MAG: acetyl-CoA carboxylase biotin carboxyl carrier protein subunit [Bacteroidetes/Chlorobi group bacterium ChocPot_Mid]
MKKMHVTVNGIRFDVEVEVYEDDEQSPYLFGGQNIPTPKRQENYSNIQTNALMSSQIKKVTQKKMESDIKSLSSPINGIILEILIKEGDSVKEHDRLFVLESMKMKTDISSPRDGKISSIQVKVGDKIEAGQLLLKYE